MREWISDDYNLDEEEFVDVENELDSSDEIKHIDARKRLERMLEEKQLREDIEDYL
ncbi:PA3496 family putative envelope integrity protein [Legionella sp. W05-934-2]|jgi:hypothetical protein|uniref:PA3496 family putative envelope integrity protein n=1 Tax=Legionella sp. W05-934-2 TaxID=1198649 RepID=UPI0034626F0D